MLSLAPCQHGVVVVFRENVSLPRAFIRGACSSFLFVHRWHRLTREVGISSASAMTSSNIGVGDDSEVGKILAKLDYREGCRCLPRVTASICCIKASVDATASSKNGYQRRVPSIKPFKKKCTQPSVGTSRTEEHYRAHQPAVRFVCVATTTWASELMPTGICAEATHSLAPS